MVTREQIHAWFSEALGDDGIWTVEDLRQMIADGHALLWVNENSALFLRIDDYPNGQRVIEVGPAGGDLDEILECVPRIEAWARENGCTQAHVQAGRVGWARALSPQGYEVFSTTIRKVLH